MRAALDGVTVAMGSAGAKTMAILRGEVDCYPHSGGQYEWDSAAPVAVARHHGLHASRLDGSPLRLQRSPTRTSPTCLVCRPELAEAAIAAARGADDVELQAPSATRSSGGVARLTLDRPERRNAWTGRMHLEYRWALTEAEADRAVRVVVVTGRGRPVSASAPTPAPSRATSSKGGYDDGLRGDGAADAGRAPSPSPPTSRSSSACGHRSSPRSTAPRPGSVWSSPASPTSASRCDGRQADHGRAQARFPRRVRVVVAPPPPGRRRSGGRLAPVAAGSSSPRRPAAVGSVLCRPAPRPSWPATSTITPTTSPATFRRHRSPPPRPSCGAICCTAIPRQSVRESMRAAAARWPPAPTSPRVPPPWLSGDSPSSDRGVAHRDAPLSDRDGPATMA